MIMYVCLGDFTPVCTTELGKMAQYSKEFYQRGVKLLGMSCDDIKSHNEWIKDIEAYTVSFFSSFHNPQSILYFCFT